MWKRLLKGILLLGLGAMVASCSGDGKGSSAGSSSASKKRGGATAHDPAGSQARDADQGALDEAPKNPAPKAPSPAQLLSDMLKKPISVRYNTPGHVRYSMVQDGPVDDIHWSVHAGLTVSSGNDLYNITTQGQERWRLKAGSGHRVFVTDEQEVVWSKQFGSVFQMLRFGRVGWKKEWPYPPAFNPPNSLFMVDASTVARLGGDGKERWRVTVDDVRKLDGPFSCENLVLFQGKRGQRSVATVVSDTGAVVRESELEFGAVVLGASFQCEPIVWSQGEVALVDERGTVKWSYPLRNRPLFFKLFNTYMLIVPDPQEDVSVLLLDRLGSLLYKRRLPISGRVTDGKVIEQSGLRQTIALCKDVSSPCARRDGGRGPFNVVLTGERGSFTVLERMVRGHNNIAEFSSQGLVYAGSAEENATTVTLRDRDGKILWDTVLPGRLSAGPFVGPYGGIYVGTCMGWNCGPPYRFISLTGAPTIDEDTASE